MANSKTITVFGSSKPLPGDSDYNFAMVLGRMLASKGFNISNGGYSGTMAAISEGASDFPVEITGVTCSILGRSGPNNWLTREIVTNNLNDRLMKLIELGDGFIALPGGTGTLLEISMVWEMMNKKIIEPRPFLLLGHSWKNVISEVIKYDKNASVFVDCIDNVEEAIDLLETKIQL